MGDLRRAVCLGLVGLVASGFMAMAAQAEEAVPRGPAAFSDFDVDGSGFISEQEFNALRQQRMAAKAAEGKKLRAAADAPAFADLDTDADGQLNPEELAAGQKARMQQHHGMGKGPGHAMGQGGDAGRGRQGNKPAFADFDLNGDGEILEGEFDEGHARRISQMQAEGRQMKHMKDAPGFAGIDTNKDGAISESEFATHQAGHHHRMHHGDDDKD